MDELSGVTAHGPWCWEQLIPERGRHGVSAVTVSLPSCTADPGPWGTLHDDARSVAEAAARIDGPVAVLGHSYGGVAISHADHPGNVARLIYLGAFMPDTGRSLVSYLPPGPLPEYVLDRGDGTLMVNRAVLGRDLYGDCDPETVAWASDQVVPQNAAAPVTPIADAAWRRIPSTYVVLSDDLAIPTPLQRVFSAQASAVRELPGSHSPFAARPAMLAELIATCLADSSLTPQPSADVA
jgi:pimeloyl-ACP methyl ester carboxylesterase